MGCLSLDGVREWSKNPVHAEELFWGGFCYICEYLEFEILV